MSAMIRYFKKRRIWHISMTTIDPLQDLYLYYPSYIRGSLSVKELAAEFNISTRTIQRNMNERLMSFPIYQDKK